MVDMFAVRDETRLLQNVGIGRCPYEDHTALDILRSHLLQTKFSCGCWQSAKPNAASCASFTWPSALKHARRPRRQEKREAVAGRVGLGGRREKNQISSIFRQLHFMSTGRARVSSPSHPLVYHIIYSIFRSGATASMRERPVGVLSV